MLLRILFVVLALVSFACNKQTSSIVLELSKARKETGTVISMEHHPEQYINPADNINPIKDLDPFFDMKKARFITKTPERNFVYIQTSVGKMVLDDKVLFNSVCMGCKVDLQLAPIYNVIKNMKGDMLSKTLDRYEIIMATKQ